MMITIYGAGAVGGFLATRLVLNGHKVSVVIRSRHLSAVRANGLILRSGEREYVGRVHASTDPGTLGNQDLVLVTLKSSSLGALATGIKPLLKRDTPVVFVQNGIPWWYGLGLQSPAHAIPDLSRLDPDGALLSAVTARRVIGAVAYSANEVIAPGVIINSSPKRNMILVGEPNDGQTDRTETIRRVFAKAGILSPPVTNIREAIWRKLVANLSSSLLGLLTGEHSNVVSRDARIGVVSERILDEGIAIAKSQGLDIDEYFSNRAEALARAPDRKPSILQDYEHGRPMEIDSLITLPVAFARAAGVPTPTLDVVAALVTRLAVNRHLYVPH